MDSSEAARHLSALGASKGGQARAKKLSPERRAEIASAAARKRWGSDGGVKGTQKKPPGDDRAAAVKRALDEHRAEVGDPGLMARVKWVKLVDRVLAALDGPKE